MMTTAVFQQMNTLIKKTLPLEEKSTIIKAFLSEREITQDTLNAIEKFELLDDHRADLILKDGCVEEDRIKELLQQVTQCQSNYDKAHQALMQFGYSQQAITLLDNKKYLNQKACTQLAKAFDQEASQVASQLTTTLRIFNTFLSMNEIKYPPLIDELKTYDDWKISDTEQAHLEQYRELIAQKGLERFVNSLTETLVDENFKAGRQSIQWNMALDDEIADMARRSQDAHDYHLEFLTGDNTQSTLSTAMKEVVKQRAPALLEKKIKRQQRINKGEEGWCEWIMRILFDWNS